MNERNINEKQAEIKVSQKKKSKWSSMTKEKKLYLLTAAGCAAVLIAVIVVAIAVTNIGGNKQQAAVNSTSTQSSVEDSSTEEGSGDVNEPVVTLPEGMISPIATASMGSDYGFYHNQTLNFYYEHTGVDFTATAGTEVYAAKAGIIESIYKNDVLLGTEITVDHGDGLKTVYRFVTEKDGLKVGDRVERGQLIATVAEANGEEYKDGAHLHFEVLENGKHVDPAIHLTLDEK